MKILIVSTQDSGGGAAEAARRLTEALNDVGCQANMLVRDKFTHCAYVNSVGNKILNRIKFMWERLKIFINLELNKEHLFHIDTAENGIDITKLKVFNEADVIHLHWVNQSMLSLKNIQQIIDSGKPVVWTMHDIWCATSLCHITRNCLELRNKCATCFLMSKNAVSSRVSQRVWNKKKQLYSTKQITFITCSNWLKHEASESALLKNQEIITIPNAIDTRIFHKQDRFSCRKSIKLPLEKKLILFVSQSLNNPDKGVKYLIEAVNMLAQNDKEFAQNTEMVIMGNRGEEIASQFHIPTHYLGFISSPQISSQIYNACNVFVLPSLSENLPNTIMEALSCGVGCVSFNVGGIPEMIQHKENGYLAEYKNSNDLAKGIVWALDNKNEKHIEQQAINKVVNNYSMQIIAKEHINLYEKLINEK